MFLSYYINSLLVIAGLLYKRHDSLCNLSKHGLFETAQSLQCNDGRENGIEMTKGVMVACKQQDGSPSTSASTPAGVATQASPEKH
jgi:hypothetical protein